MGIKESVLRLKELPSYLLTSWTAWFGLLVIVWGPEIQSLVQPLLVDWIGDKRADTFVRVLGALVIMFRAKTAMNLQMGGKNGSQ